jgi:hypothetical protein
MQTQERIPNFQQKNAFSLQNVSLNFSTKLSSFEEIRASFLKTRLIHKILSGFKRLNK